MYPSLYSYAYFNINVCYLNFSGYKFQHHCVRMLISSLQNGEQLLFKETLEIVFLILNEKISESFPSNMFNAVLIITAKNNS